MKSVTVMSRVDFLKSFGGRRMRLGSGRKASVFVPAIAGVVTIVAAIGVLLGWGLHQETLKRVIPGFVAMNPMTAVCFVAAGLYLLSSSVFSRSPLFPRLAAGFIFMVGAVKLFDLAIGSESGVDSSLFRYQLAGPDAVNMNPMAPNTAFNFVLAGTAMLLLSCPQRIFHVSGQIVALLIVVLSLISMTGYAYGAVGLYNVGTYIPMALNTAAGFLTVSAGLLFVFPECGVMAIITSPQLGGSSARRLLPAIIGIPFALGFAWIYGVQWHVVGPIHGIALFVIANVCVVTAITLGTASHLNKTATALVARTVALEEANYVAGEATRAKSNFLANMSHEIRTPMNGVVGTLEILEHTDLNDEQKRIVGTARNSARSLLEIINDILDISKIEADQLRVESVSCDITEVVESTARLFLGAAAAKNILLRCFAGTSIRGNFLTDPVRLRQILTNLVSNAIKFTTSGGVTITVDAIASDSGDTNIRLVVADTGMGITPEAQARLFQPFVQADNSTARKFGGTGLGLSISLRLAKLMKGTIELSSEKGVGTQITLTIPTSAVESDKKESPIDLQGVTVALITSDETEAKYFASDIAYWGADVTVIPNPRALQQVDKQFMLAVAPASMESEVRRTVANPNITCLAIPHRFVFFTYNIQPTDYFSPANDAITTTSRSRARFVTAVALAAGRMSPEPDSKRDTPKLERLATPLDREQALENGQLILLVEDHPVNRDVIVRQLHLLGYSVDAVENGIAALSALAQTHYGLILTDCSMPEMDGFELTRRIRELQSEESRVPIVALTANAMVGEAQKCLAAGMNGFLTKPIEMKTLRKCLEQHLPVGSVVHTIGKVATIAPLPNDTKLAQLPVLDLSLLAECFDNDQSAIEENLRLFLEAMAADLACLSEAINGRNGRQAELTAHRIKGAAQIVGGSRVATASSIIETSAATGDWPAVKQEWPRLLEASNEIEEHIAARA